VTRRDRIVILVVLVLGAVVGSWLLVIQPKRDQASQLGAQVTAQQSQLSAALAQVAAGETAKRAYAGYYTSLARLGEAVPADDNVPSLIYQLQNAAASTKVNFQNFVLVPGGSSAAPAAGSTSATQVSTATLPPGATVGAAGLPIEPFTLTFTGNFFHLATFLGRVQRFVTATDRQISVRGRLLTLNGINIGPAPAGFPQISVTINATSYLAPVAQGVLAGGTPSGPAAGSGQPAVGTGSSPSSFPTATVVPTVR
jgi:hypothetical protein